MSGHLYAPFILLAKHKKIQPADRQMSCGKNGAYIAKQPHKRYDAAGHWSRRQAWAQSGHTATKMRMSFIIALRESKHGGRSTHPCHLQQSALQAAWNTDAATMRTSAAASLPCWGRS